MPTAARFSITIDGYEIASFSELQGITTEIKTVEYVEGRDDPVRFLNQFASVPATTNLPTTYRLRLARRSGSGASLSSWQSQGATNSVTGRKKCVLAVNDSQSKPVARFYLENAWPQKVQVIPGFAAQGGNAVAMETVTIACESISLVR
ncbi:MAG: phage tail protein [Pyrinomonadaceae bacterium]